MAKRFTATDKWDKEWFQSLKPKYKCFWQYLCDKCDAAGIWDANFSLASFAISDKITEKDIQIFGDRIVKISPSKFFIQEFIQFQYGKLSPDCKPHVTVIKILERAGISLSEDSKPEIKGYAKGMDTLPSRVKDIDKDKDKEKEQDKPKGITGIFSESFAPSWEKWKEYKKKKHKFTFHDQDTERAALNELFVLSGGKEPVADKIIQQSMVAGWKGLFELKIKPAMSTVKETDEVRDDFYSDHG